MIFYNYQILKEEFYLYQCEICGNTADVHHIIHKSQGGLDFKLNYKYLCPLHHRGKNGPHRNIIIDFKYKLDMQYNLQKLFIKQFYTFNELLVLLSLNKNSLKKLTNHIKIYKEGYKSKDIIFEIMGKRYYSIEELEDIILEKYII